MILYLSFEELAALNASAERVLGTLGDSGQGIAAPPQLIGEVEHFSQRLTGDLEVPTLEVQRTMQMVLRHLVASCREAMDEAVLYQHAAAESAVAAYFDYAHVLTVSRRLDRLGEEMAAIVRLMTGTDPDSERGRRFSFPE